MGRGLGKLQKRIIERLKVRKTDPFFKTINLTVVRVEGWHHVGSLLHEVQDDFPKSGVWDDYEWHERTESEKQSFWRAIRDLEKRGLVETTFFPAGLGDRPSTLMSNYHRRGGISRKKAIHLVQIST